MTKIIEVFDEGFEPAALQMIQDAGIQPAYIYGTCPWIVSDEPLTKEEVETYLNPPEEEE